MTRANLAFPDKPPLWEFRSRIETGDLNYGGHMGNEVILKKAQEARVQLLNSWGWSEKDVGGKGLIQVEAWIVYKSEGFWGDLIRGELFVDGLHRRGFEFLYRFRIENEPVRELAWVRTTMLGFDYQRRRVAELPEGLKNRLMGD